MSSSSWTCKKCGTNFMFHPPPCPMCHDEPKIDRGALDAACREIVARRGGKSAGTVDLKDVAEVKSKPKPKFKKKKPGRKRGRS